MRGSSMPGFPRADSFLYCFTLKVGAHILCAYDQISSWLEAGLMLFVLFNRETFFKAQEGSKRSDAVLWTGEPAAAGMGGVLAYAMIAVITAVFAGAAGSGVRAGDARRVKRYVDWKWLQIGMLILLRTTLHRLWWDGCGTLLEEVCVDRKMQYLASGIVQAVPALYFQWVVWSLSGVLEEGDESAFMAAGYDAIDLQIHREQADVRERLVRGERTREGAGAEDYV